MNENLNMSVRRKWAGYGVLAVIGIVWLTGNNPHEGAPTTKTYPRPASTAVEIAMDESVRAATAECVRTNAFGAWRPEMQTATVTLPSLCRISATIAATKAVERTR